MTKNEFKKLLLRYLRENRGDEYFAGLAFTTINNEAGHECLSFRRIHGDYQITIGIESLYSVFRNDGGSFTDLSDKIIAYYDAFSDAEKSAAEGNMDGFMKDVYCRLVNYEMNEKQLAGIPHEKRLDMAVIYYLRIRVSDEEIAGVIMDHSRISTPEDEERIKAAAWENTIRDEPASLCLLSDLIGDDTYSGAPIFVVSNSERYFGAVCIYYPGFLKTIAEEIGSDLIIIPSSVHECILLPADEYTDSFRLKEMVRLVNRAELSRCDILSDSVYYYDAKKDSICIDI